MKNGIRSTEFWLTAITAAVNVYLAIGGLIPPDLAAKIVGACVIVYTIARTVVKLTPSQFDDEFLAKIEDLLKSKGVQLPQS